jgi:hypothetical protein
MSNLGNFFVEVSCDSSNVPGRDVILAEHVDDVRFNVAGISSLPHTGEVSVDVVEDANKFLTRVLLLKVVICMSDNVLSQDVSNGSVDSLVRPFLVLVGSSSDLCLEELPGSVRSPVVSFVLKSVGLDDSDNGADNLSINDFISSQIGSDVSSEVADSLVLSSVVHPVV